MKKSPYPHSVFLSLHLDKPMTQRSRRKTMADIACEAGVSAMTVSRVINKSKAVSDKTRKKVEKIIEQFDFHPSSIARRMTGKVNKALCILSERDALKKSIHSITFDSEMLRLLIVEGSNHGYRIVISTTDYANGRKQDFQNLAEEGSVFGFILMDLFDHDPRLNILKELEVPVVLLGRTFSPYPNFYAVGTDDESGGYQATEYLIKQGKKKIAYLCFQTFSTPAIDRLNGYKKALMDHQLPIDDSLICFYFRMAEEQSGYEGMKQILSTDVPEAVFCSSDLRAIGAIRAIQEAGFRVPEDIAVVGFDGLSVADLCQVPITTIQQPFLQMAQNTVDIFNQLEANPKAVERIRKLPGKLIKRSSA